MMNREKAVLIDVSEPREFGAGHAAQARNVPIGQLESSKDLPTIQFGTSSDLMRGEAR
jgi:rhodanese-related sulfurtransferase